MDQQPPRRGAQRTGALLSTELLFILPIFVIVALIIMQFVHIHAAYMRVQAAALDGANVAAHGGDMDETEDAVILTMGYLAGVGFELKREYDPTVVAPDDEVNEGDTVAIGLRIPMGAVSTNYVGLLGGSVHALQIRSVVMKRMRVDLTGAAPYP